MGLLDELGKALKHVEDEVKKSETSNKNQWFDIRGRAIKITLCVPMFS